MMMTQRRVAFVSTLVVVLIGAIAVAWYSLGPSRRVQTASQAPITGKAQVGQLAPEFAVATTAGLFDLAKATKPVFLEIFATWCPHCQREAAVIDKLYSAYRNRVAFVGVSGSDTAMDGTSEASQADVLAWTQRYNVRYPVAYDAQLTVANLYLSPSGFPTLVIIGKDKKVAYLNAGEISYDDLATALNSVLPR